MIANAFSFLIRFAEWAEMRHYDLSISVRQVISSRRATMVFRAKVILASSGVFFSGASGAFLFFLIGKIFGEKPCAPPLPPTHPLRKITPNLDLRNIVIFQRLQVKTTFSLFSRDHLSVKFRQNYNSVKYIFRKMKCFLPPDVGF